MRWARGAFGYLQKPLDLRELELEHLVVRAIASASSQQS
jgi:hypothetical protein